jgi:hypothetical protein
LSDTPDSILATVPDGDSQQQSADINITARGDRRTLEALYLELRELARKNGLAIEYRLTLSEPEVP